MDDEALLVVEQGAGLKRDERLTGFGLQYLDVVRIDELLFGDAVAVGRPRLVLEQDIVSLN